MKANTTKKATATKNTNTNKKESAMKKIAKKIVEKAEAKKALKKAKPETKKAEEKKPIEPETKAPETENQTKQTEPEKPELTTDMISRDEISKEQYSEQAAKWAACNGAKTDIPYELWFFFQQIVLSVDDRPVMKHCYSTGDKMIATNGKILAITPTSLPRGFYEPAVIGKGKKGIHNFTPVYEAGIYPNIFAVIPDTKEHNSVHVNFKANNPLHAELFALQFTLATLGHGLILMDNTLDFISSTLAEFDCKFKGAFEPVVFENEDLKIITMPAREEGQSHVLKAIREYRDQVRALVKEGKEPDLIGAEETEKTEDQKAE